MIYKRGKVYWYKFMWHGQLIRESTKQGNDKIARNMESAHRTSLAQGLVGIRERKPAPVLRDFLNDDFLTYVETKHALKVGTVEYYSGGGKIVLQSRPASPRFDRVTAQGAPQVSSPPGPFSAPPLNIGLRPPRRAPNLAAQSA